MAYYTQEQIEKAKEMDLQAGNQLWKRKNEGSVPHIFNADLSSLYVYST